MASTCAVVRVPTATSLTLFPFLSYSRLARIGANASLKSGIALKSEINVFVWLIKPINQQKLDLE
jgi:hypothetical protein